MEEREVNGQNAKTLHSKLIKRVEGNADFQMLPIESKIISVTLDLYLLEFILKSSTFYLLLVTEV